MGNNIVSEDYRIASTEVLDILKHLPDETVKRIPKKLIEFFENVSISDYEPKIDYSKGLDKIELKTKTKALLAMIYRNYLCSDSEREEVDRALIKNEEEYQQNLREKYNPDKIFEENYEKINKSVEKNTQLMVYKEKWYKKVFKKIFYIIKNK